MKTSTRQLFLSAAIAWFLTFTLGSFAQDPTPAPSTPPAEEPKTAPATKPDASTPAATAPAAEPATPAPAVTETTPAAESKPAAEQPAAPKLRRLDIPSTPAPGDEKPARRVRRLHSHTANGNEIVMFWQDAFLAKEHKADAVVAIFGSATADGEVQDAVVSVFGNSKASGPVGDSVVAVFGDARATGPVGDAVVAAFGNTYVNSKVGDAVVAVFGSVELGPDAEVGDVVAVGGVVKRDPKAIVHGQVNNVSLGGMFTDMDWLNSWFTHCARYLRLLAFAPHLMWAWWIALGFLALYVVIALLFGKGVEKCVETFEQRPGYSILAALLTVLLAPIVMILLICTGIGIAVVPFLAAGLFFAGLFGKAVMLAWLGRRLTRPLGLNHIAVATLIGGVIVLLLYTVPFLSIILYKLFGWLGLGVVVYTLMLNMKREKPVVAPVTPPPTAPIIDPVTGAILVPALIVPPVVVTTLPRAGFWIRMAALLLDVILVGVILKLLHSHGSMELLALAAYAAIMWKLRGSTIGGIICGLKVVRLDERPLDWSTAIVRALGCFLSLVIVGLGFIWVAFDDQKQSWHDKIAGTTVVRVPKGVSLV
ncbi:MAG: domain containing protein [Verrucomicrobia bacterium]|nr:domain containing protein [Verrucomicrobiota bacterium]